jgi:hypothetical protein
VIRENKDENNGLSLVELNSQFEFTNMQWIPKVVEYSKLINLRIIALSKVGLILSFELLM